MYRYRFDIAYDGTGYFGWQVQPNGVTVQETLEGAAGELAGETVKVHGSGRTDQGVHARAQVAHCDLRRRWGTRELRNALNALLPPDVRVLRVARAVPDFHARKSTTSKEYRYFVWNGDVLPPLVRNCRFQVTDRLDVAAMQTAAGLLVGRHDFAAFTANPNRVVLSTVRELFDLRVTRRGSEVVIAAVGEGFLYKMVRSLAGWLIKVGKGNDDPAATTEVLDSLQRTARVPTAPACGLFLWRVTY